LRLLLPAIRRLLFLLLLLLLLFWLSLGWGKLPYWSRKQPTYLPCARGFA
jgi:hypothetical protein